MSSEQVYQVAAQQRWEQRQRLPRQIISSGTVEKEVQARLRLRQSNLHPNDGLALERVLGRSDLVGINYLEIGLLVSRSVGRIQVRDISGQALGYGTGFMISPDLLLTNHHVLETPMQCRRSLVDFNFEDDASFIPRPISTFPLQPDRLFYTDETLDFSLVAVSPAALDGSSLERFGFLRLHPEPGKVLPNEYVSIIQHPHGATKQVTVRENQVSDIFDDFIHYTTDTQPGSSGAPVFNDQWMVVALHHAGVQKFDDESRLLSIHGIPWTPDMGESQIQWIANEGIRISSIFHQLQAIRPELSPEQRRLLNEALEAYREDNLAPPPTSPRTVVIRAVTQEKGSYLDRQGYDAGFLGGRVPLPRLSARLQSDCAPLLDESGVELKYTHFSIVMSKSRKLPFFTAVNIDGSQLQKMKRDTDRWYFDPRLDQRYQLGPELYSDNALDRGHLVRRLDPVWGEQAVLANEDTFHFTNCSPQHEALNRRIWNDLEEYILSNADLYDLRVVVFTGPVFRPDDFPYRNLVQIPAEFWKVIVVRKNNRRLSATAYLQSQKNLLRDLEFAYGAYRTYQVPILQIENLTGLSFSRLRRYDPIAESLPQVHVQEQANLIAASAARIIESADHIKL